MRKFLLTAISAIVLLVDSSAYYPTTSGCIGKDAPNFTVTNDSATIEIKKLNGHYVLLSFWSSIDPKSRIANKTYNDLIAATNSNVEYVAVNFDPSSKVFDEIVKIDDLNTATQFHIDSNTLSTIWDNYNLRDGYISILINPNGKIVEQNPSVENIKAIAAI